MVNQASSTTSQWVIAIDGGGSKVTGAASKFDLAAAYPPNRLATIRQVVDGTGSASIATWDEARSNLITMLERLIAEAAIGPEKISSAVLMLAGAGRPEDVARVTESLIHDSPFGSCVRLTVTSDIQPLLCEARDCDTASSSIVVIAGTGSLVAALDASGQVVRAGGWGPTLGDEGSGWRIAQAFLKPFCTWIDGGLDPARTPDGLHLLTSFLAAQHMPIASEKLNSAIIALASDRRLAAQLRPPSWSCPRNRTVPLPFNSSASKSAHLLIKFNKSTIDLQFQSKHGDFACLAVWRPTTNYSKTFS